MALRLTNAGDYAIRGMIHIACLPDNTYAKRDDVARAQRIPASFTAKVLGSLVKAGLLKSRRGSGGGFVLGRPASEITLLEIVEALEGPVSLTECATDPRGCELSDDCPAGTIWLRIQEQMLELLRSTTLEALVSTPRRAGRVASAVSIGAASLGPHSLPKRKGER